MARTRFQMLTDARVNWKKRGEELEDGAGRPAVLPCCVYVWKSKEEKSNLVQS